MRTKCEEKQEALFEATVKLVNEIGFAASSVAKIAKEANVSAATLYIYYKNKGKSVGVHIGYAVALGLRFDFE